MREFIVRVDNDKFTFEGEMVHCQDCRHRDLFSCPLVDNDFQKDEDFCSWGERKEKKQVTGKLETDKNPDSLWSKGMSPFGVLDDGETSTNEGETPTTSKTETVDTPTNTPTNTPTDLISRQAVKYHTQLEARGNGQYEEVEVAYKSDIESLPPVEDMGEVSDGYHTFNQLYHQRAVLFATIVNQNKDNAWKSWKHEDGKFCFDKEGEWFIVGVDTPEGSYTYHYEKKYWDLFDCKELDRGKHWDGHTEDDVVRLLSLPPETHDKRTETHGVCSDCISRQQAIDGLCQNCEAFDCIVNGSYCGHDCTEVAILKNLPPVEPKRPQGEWKYGNGNGECPFCGRERQDGWDRFCGFCGADMRGDEDV